MQRMFSGNPSKTTIQQINRYQYSDGRSIEKQWTYDIKTHSKPDGLVHPASSTIRGIAFDDGAAALLIPALQPNQFVFFELFLMRGERRHSVGVIYGKDGRLMQTSSIRETRHPQPNHGWSEAIEQVKPWRVEGRWMGHQQRILPDLSRMPGQQVQWRWNATEVSEFTFPDQIVLRCPEQLIPNQAFTISVHWLATSEELQTIAAEYNRKAELVHVTHETLSPAD